MFGMGAFEEAMLRETVVQGEPNEGAHFAGAGVVPDSNNHLRVGGVLEIWLLDKGTDVRGLGWFPRVFVTPFCRVSEER
jgi:hypothetical protein